jgi:hypothetical protein
MNRLLLALLLIFSLTNCKKIKEDIQEKKVLDFITNGQWKIIELTKGSIDYVGDFTGYQFQFKTNNFVDAIKGGMIQKTGTWQGDVTNFTITSNFPVDTVFPLTLLNGNWLIVDGSDNYVKATKNEGGELSVLKLEKI